MHVIEHERKVQREKDSAGGAEARPGPKGPGNGTIGVMVLAVAAKFALAAGLTGLGPATMGAAGEENWLMGPLLLVALLIIYQAIKELFVSDPETTLAPAEIFEIVSAAIRAAYAGLEETDYLSSTGSYANRLTREGDKQTKVAELRNNAKGRLAAIAPKIQETEYLQSDFYRRLPEEIRSFFERYLRENSPSHISALTASA